MREPWQEEASLTYRVEREMKKHPTCPRCGEVIVDGKLYRSQFTEELVCDDCIDREIDAAVDIVYTLAEDGRRAFKREIKEETC